MATTSSRPEFAAQSASQLLVVRAALTGLVMSDLDTGVVAASYSVSNSS